MDRKEIINAVAEHLVNHIGSGLTHEQVSETLFNNPSPDGELLDNIILGFQEFEYRRREYARDTYNGLIDFGVNKKLAYKIIKVTGPVIARKLVEWLQYAPVHSMANEIFCLRREQADYKTIRKVMNEFGSPIPDSVTGETIYKFMKGVVMYLINTKERGN